MYILYTHIYKVYIQYIYIYVYIYKRKQSNFEYDCMLRHSKTVSMETLIQLTTQYFAPLLTIIPPDGSK
jgi:hypothetical protein